MRLLAAADLDRALSYEALVEALADAFLNTDIAAPVRHRHAVANADGDGSLLLMPAWTTGGERYLGSRIATVFPGNVQRGLPVLHDQYLLMSGESGEALALIEGAALAAWRTAGISALASRFLSRPDAAHLVMVGAGALAPHLIRAHASVRPIRRVTIWNRTTSKAVALGFGLAVTGIEAEVTDDLEAAVREADIVSCATRATAPLIAGEWLKNGTHLDLVGGFTPKMREADDLAVARARIYVDSRAALKEAGDLTGPLRKKAIAPEAILGDLRELCRGGLKSRPQGRSLERSSGQTGASRITLFKSVFRPTGNAVEDLATAMLVWKRRAS
jgi:alanine dehydrogenase